MKEPSSYCVSGWKKRTRSKQGTVLIQTYNPEHYAIIAAHHDYQSFYKKNALSSKGYIHHIVIWSV
ncbi:MAG: hypothetical protein ACLUIS_02215 [Longibaculum sp.]